MKTLTTWIKNLFRSPTYGDRLEAYIVSKHPVNHADIEHWANAFERATRKGLI
jgi:hypothetical protein